MIRKSWRHGIMVLAVTFSLSAVFLLWHGCGGGGGGGGTSGSTQIASATIGPGGGDLSAPDNIVTMSVPQGALTSSLNFTMFEDPTTPPASAGTLISKTYDIGPNGTQFGSPVEITFAYDAAKVPPSTNEQSLKVYHDEGGGWTVTPSTVDTTNKKVSCQVTHLTRFALLAPADTTPPSPPDNITLSQVNDYVFIQWTNPPFDFHHIRIFRSKHLNQLPSLLKDNITGEVYEDHDVKPGETCSYLIKSVDPFGNESTNSDVYSITITITNNNISGKWQFTTTATSVSCSPTVPPPDVSVVNIVQNGNVLTIPEVPGISGTINGDAVHISGTDTSSVHPANVTMDLTIQPGGLEMKGTYLTVEIDSQCQIRGDVVAVRIP